MEIATDILLFNSLQYAATKKIRQQYNLTSPELQILSSIYYLQVIRPVNSPTGKAKRVNKAQIRELNPQMNASIILHRLQKLFIAGLIDYEPNESYKYKLALTIEGKQVIESIFSLSNIYDLLESKK